LVDLVKHWMALKPDPLRDHHTIHMKPIEEQSGTALIERSSASGTATDGELGNRTPAEVTNLLSRVNQGDRDAFDQLMPMVYHELHRIAEGYARRESQLQTMQPTALIHETYLRLVASSGACYQSRTHFFGIAARVMRQILVDHARARQAAKRGPDAKVEFEQRFDVAPERDRIVLALDDALNTLARYDNHKSRLVEMHFFGGMSAEEIAGCGETSAHTVRRELRAAQAWLRKEIET
jgi:RNA polymerase sigma-70 factor (ECF subfamily)